MRKMNQVFAFVLSLLLAGSVAAGDKYEIDRAHSSISFAVKHLVISNTRGNFTDFTGELMVDEQDITKSSISVTAKAASIDTDNERRNNHLKSADFLDVEKFPEVKFESKKIMKEGDGYKMVGDLTIKGVTKEVMFPFELRGPVDTPMGRRLGADATFTIDRQDYGVSWSKTLDDGGLVAGDEVKIMLELEATKASAGTN